MEDVRPRRILWTWLPIVAYAGALLALSSRPANQLPPVLFPGADKLVHMALYSLLGGLAARAAVRARLERRSAAVLLVACIAFGLFDEWYQHFIPGRSSSLLDVAADAIGACAGFFLVLRYHRSRHVPRHSPLR